MAPRDGPNKNVNKILELLSVVSMDSIDNSVLERETKRCAVQWRQFRHSFPVSPQKWDQQVEGLILQLRESLKDTPERHADMALEQKPARPAYMTQNRRPQQNDDDSNMHSSYPSYPKIGPGYSDSISVVSDLTTPTVVTGIVVPEDEKYDVMTSPLGFSQKSKLKFAHQSIGKSRDNSPRKLQHPASQPRRLSRRLLAKTTGYSPRRRGGSVASGSTDSFIASIRSSGKTGISRYGRGQKETKNKGDDKQTSRVLIDEDGFLVGAGNQQDCFVTGSNSFKPDFTKNTFQAGQYPGSAKLKKKKGSSKRALKKQLSRTEE